MLRQAQREKETDAETRFEKKQENQVSSKQYTRILED